MQQQGQFITLRDGCEAKAVVAPELGGWLLRYTRHIPGHGYVDALHYSREAVDRYPNQMYAGNPLLFPLVSFNHTPNREHSYEWQGLIHPMPQHGFARKSRWRTAQVSENSVTLELSDSPETLNVYPFRFLCRIVYRLEDGRLHFRQTIENRGDRVMPFGTGIHPYFKAPLSSLGTRKDCFIELPPARRIIPHGQWESWTAEDTPAQGLSRLSAMEDASGTFFFTDLARPEVSLVDERSGLRLRFNFAGAPKHRFIALWSRSDADPFYCIEPWTALPNAFAREQSELILLQPEQQFTAEMWFGLEQK